MNLRGQGFKCWLWVPLLAILPLSGCFFFDDWELTETKQLIWGWGLVSDSTKLSLILSYDHFEDGWEDKYETRDYKLVFENISFGRGKTYWEKNIISKSINYRPGNVHERLIVADSILFFFGMNIGGNYHIDQIMVCRLGDKEFQQAKKMELKFKNIELKGEGWHFSENIRIRPWQDGVILANYRGWDGVRSGNHYALIDTTARTFELWTPPPELEWMNECEDVKWSSIGGLCLKSIPDTTGFVLLKNGVDTLVAKYNNESNGSLEFNKNIVISKDKMYIFNEQGKVSEEPLNL